MKIRINLDLHECHCCHSQLKRKELRKRIIEDTPDVSYHQIYTQHNSYLIGNQLVRYQMGSSFVSTIATIGPIGIVAAIGALIGAMVGGALGAVVGALIGVTMGAELAYVENVIYVDGQGALWWWANLGFWHSISNIPWYL